MGYLGLGEPGLGSCIILAGVWINRNPNARPLISELWRKPFPQHDIDPASVGESDIEKASANTSKRRLSNATTNTRPSRWHLRQVRIFGLSRKVQTPNPAYWEHTLASCVLERFPFLIELVYWSLIYGVYQMGRGRLAVWRTQHTIDSARHHALQVIQLEQFFHLFIEQHVQRFFLKSSMAMWCINRIYSFVHLPATITFLVVLYWYAVTRVRDREAVRSTFLRGKQPPIGNPAPWVNPDRYEARRRALALCNILAFVVFSTWPCMPPRLLAEDNTETNSEATQRELATGRSFHFVDTVHTRNGAISVWNTKKYTNQLAAMPSLHFGYSLMIGLTLLTLPMEGTPFWSRSSPSLPTVAWPTENSSAFSPRLTGMQRWVRLGCRMIGVLYPLTILVVIIATANHFVLDAVVGGSICLAAWRYNEVMLNLRVAEDWVLFILRVSKPKWGTGIDEHPEGDG